MIQCADKMVSYETFINDIAARVAAMIAEDAACKKQFISQAEAFRQYGRANVERWRTKNLVEPRKTAGKLEYPTARLRELSRIKQDYLL